MGQPISQVRPSSQEALWLSAVKKSTLPLVLAPSLLVDEEDSDAILIRIQSNTLRTHFGLFPPFQFDQLFMLIYYTSK